ncbi:MAG: mechanosensitive ion channel family protein [Atopobiaceae bacterium]
MDWGAVAAFFSLDAIGGKILYLAATAAIAYVIERLLSAFLSRMFDATDIPAASIFVNIVKAFIWALALLAVLQPVFGIQPTAFVAALGVTSVVISLGLQDTVSNVIGGLGLMIGQVVKPGDYITVGSQSGIVTDVTWRNTLLKDATGSVQIIPNSVLNKTAVTIRSASDVTSCTVPLQLRSDVDVEEATADILMRGQEALGDWADPAFEPLLCLVSFGTYGIEAKAIFHVKADQSTLLAADKVARAIAGTPWLVRMDREAAPAGAARP